MSPAQPPFGTVTFLFTDIEGSTTLWEAQPEEMRLAVARHDSLIRDAITAARGHIFKTVGDAFCAAFATAPEAVSAVLAAQLAMVSEPWAEGTPIKVRMALHTGAVEFRDEDYFGQPLNRTARLLAIGHGGQTLVSGVAYDLCRDNLPESVMFRDLGEHRLKDLGRLETVFQLLHPDLPDDFPPLRSLNNPELPNNLPQQTTSLIGREKAVEEVKSLVETNHLVTLTGSGGCGKTRLSVQVAADLLDGTGDGVWLVELASLSDPNLVPQAVANVLGAKEEPGKSISQTLVEWLKKKNLLLVLDNCEHLLEECAKVADAIIRSCPGVKILASSREALGITGEQSYRVPSLETPDPKQTYTIERLSQFASAQLFIDRARMARLDFEITNANAPALVSLCHHLDGIPLAIELAAARVRALSVEEINDRLHDRFRFLTGGSRTALPRQQTLRALIDWSYDLLSEKEQTMLRRLSVFSGGWTLEAAESVCSDPE
jgi:class 3 adenylate cyclase/energy-coupling factor transporter ATP-binding protein EcfA2